LAVQRSHTPDAAEDAMLAVTQAWERGLLRPGIADVALLDWSVKPPSQLAALAAALDGIARDGLMSVVWPVLDDLVEASLQAPRLLAGTAELADVMAAFLPETQYAAEHGLADQSALALPGTRALAQRPGSSRAVATAQRIAALLPPVKAAPRQEVPAAPVLSPPFDQVWPAAPKQEAVYLEDGVTVTVDWADPALGSKRPFLFTLTLPDIADRVFQVVNDGWYYDLEREGQCRAYAVAPGTTTFEGHTETQVWLHWDTAHQAMTVHEHRNWKEGIDGPLKGVARPPLPASLLTVLIGLLAQDGDAVYYAPRLLEEFIQRGQIDKRVIGKATRTLLPYPVVSPAKLMRPLEKDIHLLPVLWPMLTECIKAAGALAAAGENPPLWSNRVLDTALRHAPYLAEAARRGFIGAKEAQWAGLSALASSKSKSAAVMKAQKLLGTLG
jgi:hypothetical protein